MERDLRALIARVRGRWLKLVVLRTVGRAAALAAVPIVAGLAIDGAVDPHGWPLILLAAGAIVGSLAAAAIPALRVQRRPGDRLVARYIEERAAAAPGGASLDDALVSAVDVADGRNPGGSAAFTQLIVSAAVGRLQAIDPSSIIESAALKKAALESVAGLLALAVVIGLGWPSLRRAADTAWIAAFPDAVHVEVLPGDARVVAGQPLRITTKVRSKSGALTGLPAMLSVTGGGEQRTVQMTRDGEQFRFDFASVDRTFQYRVTAGTAASARYTVSAVFPPQVRRIDVRYLYPSFSGLAPRDEEDGGDIYAPAGTRVRLRIHADRAVASGELALSAAPAVGLRAAGEKVLEGELTLARDDSYRVRLTDGDGLRGAGNTEYFIRVMDDRPPDVRIIRPSRDQQITPLEEVAIEARADDDYGISAFDLVYSVSGGPERAVAFPRVTGTNVQKIGTYLLPAEELGVQPGDVITYYARARDVGRGKRPTDAKSDMFFLEVKPFGEEFVAAQSQTGAGAGAGGTRIEALIAAQKEIINATWNIERRSDTGRSEADIRAIAQAQAELRARVEQMGRGGGGRGLRPQFPQRPGGASSSQPPPSRGQRPRGGDPIGAAAAAMTQAQQQLESQRTRDAIPHEMAALNALLQAQAEVRRRQVAQQRASGGGGGSNRSGEDLSALFDKELQRQQRTNYETRSQVEERPDRAQSQDSALDRIRDLARRQEELNRQQRELAGGNLSAEQIKRRLERLTREQEALRQQAEELAKQNAQQGQGSAMRDVSEQMRDATSDLRREDARSAAQKGERAAGQLRSLEQQARGGGADGKQRAAGELQLEAQQIAEAQRRVAAEAERLEREGAGTSDAKRRLADEKDRLAGRVDELQRGAKQAGQEDAARELERGQVGQRMRQTATQLREGSQRTSGEEQQLARTLDQVSGKLGGGAGAEGQRLGEQLKQTQAIRDRLNRLEQQMREAEARQQQLKAGRSGAREPGGPAARTPGEGRGQRAGESGREARASGSQELEKLRTEYQRELQRAREAVNRLQQGEQRVGEGSTPEQQEYSRSAPGTEQFKQDRSKWESLRKDVDLALERYEAGVSDRLTRKEGADRLSAGASDRVPDKYRDLVAKYFQSLATGKRR